MTALLCLLVAMTAPGDTATFVLRDFRFASGETLPELRLHYLTLGRPRRDAAGMVRNAVLILHGTGGSGSQFLSPLFAGELYGPGQPLDTASHYLILPDDIGHGRSSKPSDGLRARFPRYGYDDMVLAEYRLVTEGLHVDHLLLVMGTSMGCMHSWLWAERHPDVMDGVVPLACLPTQIAGRNRMWRRLVSDDIRGDPDWNGGNYTRQPGACAPRCSSSSSRGRARYSYSDSRRRGIRLTATSRGGSTPGSPAGTRTTCSIKSRRPATTIPVPNSSASRPRCSLSTRRTTSSIPRSSA